jgi:hypothetical protein
MRKWLVTCILSVCLSPLLFAGSDWIGINTGLQYFKLKSLYYYDAEGGEYQMDSYLYEQISVSILFENSTYFTQTRGFGMNYGMGITFPRWSTQEGVTSQEDTWMVDSFLLKFGPTYRFIKTEKFNATWGLGVGLGLNRYSAQGVALLFYADLRLGYALSSSWELLFSVTGMYESSISERDTTTIIAQLFTASLGCVYTY